MKLTKSTVTNSPNDTTLFNIHCGEWFYYYPMLDDNKFLTTKELAVCILDQDGDAMYYSPDTGRFMKYSEGERRGIACTRILKNSTITLVVNLDPHEV